MIVNKVKAFGEVIGGTQSISRLFAGTNRHDARAQKRKLVEILHRMNPNLDPRHWEFWYSFGEIAGEMFLINKKVLNEK